MKSSKIAGFNYQRQSNSLEKISDKNNKSKENLSNFSNF